MRMRARRAYTIIAASILLGSSVAMPTEAADPSGASESSEKFARLSDQFIKETLARAPHSASQAGYHKHLDEKTGKTVELDAVLDDLSLEAIYDDLVFYKSWRHRFQEETPRESLNAQDAADFDLINDQIGLYLLEVDRIQTYRHNPTVQVELVGSAIAQPLYADYAPKDVRLGHVLSRISEIPRLLKQVKGYMEDADPVYLKTAIEENAGNIEMIETTLASEVGSGSLKARYEEVAPPAVTALKEFSAWLSEDLAKRPSPRSWRLGEDLYKDKFKLVMETDVTPEKLLSDAETDLKNVRREMLELALPLHKKMFKNCNHSDLVGKTLENKVIGEVLSKISDEHPHRDELQKAVEADVLEIKKFISGNTIVTLSPRSNLKVIPTPLYMRGVYSVAGFHSAPPLEPESRAEYWVTPIDPSVPQEKAESKLREYNYFALKWLTIHEALPGHYTQFEHLNNLKPERRRLLRSLYGNGAYIEGWAEYIAQVMMDEGYLKTDPRFKLVMKKIRLRVIANTILDIKMHTMNMTDEEALSLMVNDTFQTQAEAEGKLKRAKLTSTQLPTYYVGLREWLGFRKRYQESKGKEFDMVKFHDAALDLGPLPVAKVESFMLPQTK